MNKEAIENFSKSFGGALGELFMVEFVKQVDKVRERIADAAQFWWDHRLGKGHVEYLRTAKADAIVRVAGKRQEHIASNVADAARFLYVERGFAQHSLTSQSHEDYVELIDRDRKPVADAAWRLLDDKRATNGWLARSSGEHILRELKWFVDNERISEAFAYSARNVFAEMHIVGANIRTDGLRLMKHLKLATLSGLGQHGEKIIITDAILPADYSAELLTNRYGIVQLESVSIRFNSH